MTIAEQIPYDLRDIYLKTLAAHLIAAIATAVWVTVMSIGQRSLRGP
jgi:hypothetical protein